MRRIGLVLVLGGALAAHAALAQSADRGVTTYHAGADRAGRYIVPGLTWNTAARLHRDAAFNARVDGAVYSQPLYWHPSGSQHGVLIVATETNHVYALDAVTGKQLWVHALGTPAPNGALPCGNIHPLGVTGTPAIDAASRSVFLDAVVMRNGQARHLVFGLSLDDGAARAGWPVDVGVGLQAKGIAFEPEYQNQRGALMLFDGRLYVPYGGHFGDCGQYHGIVAGLDLQHPAVFAGWSTRAAKGGIWAPGGISSDGHSMFVSTGNTQGANRWGDGEAVIRLSADLHHATDAHDFFAPSNWKQLDEADLDMSGVAPLPLDVPAGNGTSALMLALGKDGKAYLLNRANLGGIGGALLTMQVANQRIITGPAVYRVGDAVFVAFQGSRLACPGAGENGVAALKITAGARPDLRVAWCGAFAGRGSPVVTTSDGKSDPIVWVVGAEGDERLHGFRGDTGQVLFDGGAQKMPGIKRFSTILVAEGRLYVAGGGRVYAFELSPG